MAKKLLGFIFVLVLLVWSEPSQAAATFDATGTWTWNWESTAIDPSGTPQDSWAHSTEFIISQTSSSPNDQFIWGVVGRQLHSGQVYADLYVVEGPVGGPPFIPAGELRPWSFVPDNRSGSGRYYLWLWDDFHWTVKGKGDKLKGYFRCTATGYYTTTPGPGPLYFEPNIVDWVTEGTFTATRTRLDDSNAKSGEMKVYEVRLEPSTSTFFDREIRGFWEVPIPFVVKRNGAGQSMCKAKIETDFEGTATLTIDIRGLKPEDLTPGAEPPLLDVVCDCGGDSVTYPDVIVLDKKANAKATIDITSQMPCYDPAVLISEGIVWIAAPIVP